MKKKGFTLIELLVVIAIIGLLSTLAVVSLGAARGKARDAKRISDVKAIQTAMEMYKSDHNDVGTSATSSLSQYIQGGFPLSSVYATCASSTSGLYVIGVTLEGNPATPGSFSGTVPSNWTCDPTTKPTCNGTTGFCVGSIQ